MLVVCAATSTVALSAKEQHPVGVGLSPVVKDTAGNKVTVTVSDCHCQKGNRLLQFGHVMLNPLKGVSGA